jgi:enamine deaminase RidA (YjgF/YER057c/UK114 family)
MSKIDFKINKLGYKLPNESAPIANYIPTVVAEKSKLIFTAGHLPKNVKGEIIVGKLGDSISNEDGYNAAKAAALATLGSIKSNIGSLDNIKRIVKLLVMVNSIPEFKDHPAIANGASDLLVEIFEEKGFHARSAVGVTSLPLGAAVEIDLVAEIH